jgi:ribose transport system permease protein
MRSLPLHTRRIDAANAWRTVVGCLFVALVANGFNLLGGDPFYQQVTLGVILLLAVGTDAWSRRLA